jgi:hypothetical protein
VLVVAAFASPLVAAILLVLVMSSRWAVAMIVLLFCLMVASLAFLALAANRSGAGTVALAALDFVAATTALIWGCFVHVGRPGAPGGAI